MKKIIKTLFLCSALLSLASCGNCVKHQYKLTKVEPTLNSQGYSSFQCLKCHNLMNPKYTGLTGEKEVEKPKYSFLFIGNSYTFYNDLPKTFLDLVTSRGYEATVDSVTAGAYTLEKMNDPSDTYGAQVAEKLANNKYDIVFLQEQSFKPSTATGRTTFYSAVRSLTNKFQVAGSQVILYSTWGYKDDNANISSYGGSTDVMARNVQAGYEAIAQELDLPVSRVGQAMLDVYTNHKDISLYANDSSHPTQYGTYMAAMVHYSMVYGKSCVGADYIANKGTTTISVPTPDKQTLEVLQKAAHDAAFSLESIVTEQYKVSSEGK